MSPKLFLVPVVAAAMFVCVACEKQPDQTARNDGSETSATTSAKYSSDDLAKGQRASDVSDPQTALANASVENNNGESLGQIKSITVGSDGKAQAVNIEVASASGGANKTVAVDAAKFTYLPDHNVLVAQLAKSDLDSMPAVPVQ